MLLYDWKRCRIVANANNSHQKQKKCSANIVLLCTVYDQVSDLFDFSLLGSKNFLKLLVK